MLKYDDEARSEWEEVRNDSSDKNWIMLGYDDNEKDKIVSLGSGTGGYDEFVQLFDENQVMYGVFRVFAVDDDSRRTKFVFVTFVGEKVSPLKRARVSTHKNAFELFFKGLHVEFRITDPSELTKEDIEKKLNSSTGAHKPKGYEY